MVTPEEFSTLVADIYDAALEPSRWEHTLQRLAAATGGTAGAMVIAQPRTNRLDAVSVGMDPQAVVAYNSYYGRIDPVAAALQRANVGAVLTSSTVISRRERKRSEFCNDWASPNDVCDGVFVTLLREDAGTSGLCLAGPLHLRS